MIHPIRFSSSISLIRSIRRVGLSLAMFSIVAGLGIALPAAALEPGVETGWFAQRIDHRSSARRPRTFPQKYFIYTASGARRDGPIFYMLGNESLVTEAFLTGTIMKTLADRYRGRAAILEHRFYGDSIPGDRLSNAALKAGLSTDSALNDDRAFQSHLAGVRGWTGPVIVIGSSYAGNLAAYYALRYPEAVAGAIVSSAPLRATPVGSGMDEIAARSMSPACLVSVRNRSDGIETRSRDASYFIALTRLLDASGISDARSVLQTIGSTVTTATQRGMLGDFCAKALELDTRSASDAEWILGTLAIVAGPDSRFSENAPEFYADERTEKHRGFFGQRQWFFQACTEYGYWEVAGADEGSRFRARSVDFAYYDELCRKSYGVGLLRKPRAFVTEAVSRIESASGLRMLVLNGDGDPWSAFAISAGATERGLEVVNLKNGYHGTGINPPVTGEEKSDPASALAHRSIFSAVERWLARAKR